MITFTGILILTLICTALSLGVICLFWHLEPLGAGKATKGGRRGTRLAVRVWPPSGTVPSV
jgi:hypothetical protein